MRSRKGKRDGHHLGALQVFPLTLRSIPGFQVETSQGSRYNRHCTCEIVSLHHILLMNAIAHAGSSAPLRVAQYLMLEQSKSRRSSYRVIIMGRRLKSLEKKAKARRRRKGPAGRITAFSIYLWRHTALAQCSSTSSPPQIRPHKFDAAPKHPCSSSISASPLAHSDPCPGVLLDGRGVLGTLVLFPKWKSKSKSPIARQGYSFTLNWHNDYGVPGHVGLIS